MDDVVIRPVPASAPAPAPEGPGPWWRRPGALLGIGGTVVVVVAVAVVLVLRSGSGPDGAEAAGQAGKPPATAADGSLLDMDTSVSTTVPGGDVATTAPGATGDGSAATGGGAQGGGGATGGGGGVVLVPRFGSYTYTGSGSERTTPFLPTPVPQGPTKPATVADAGSGCWRLTIEQNARHSDAATFCAGGDGSLVLASIAVDQTNDLGRLGRISSTLTTTCPSPIVVVSPGMAPGAQFPLRCTVHTVMSTNMTVADSSAIGTATFVGVETVGVEGAQVPAYHLHQEVRLTPDDGAPAGSRVSDLWIATDDGMVLRETRSMTASAKLLGQVSTYTETSEHTLTSR